MALSIHYVHLAAPLRDDNCLRTARKWYVGPRWGDVCLMSQHGAKIWGQEGDLCLMSQWVDSMWDIGGGMCVLCHSMGPKTARKQYVDSMWGPGGGSVSYVTVGGQNIGPSGGFYVTARKQYVGPRWEFCVLCHSGWTVCGAKREFCVLYHSGWTVCGAQVGVLCLMSQWVDSMWGPMWGSVFYVTVGGQYVGPRWGFCVLCHSVWTVCGALEGDLCLISQWVDSMWGPGGGSVSYVTVGGQYVGPWRGFCVLCHSGWTVCGAQVGVLCLMSQWVDSMWGPGGGSVSYVMACGQYVGPRWGFYVLCHSGWTVCGA